MKQLRNQTLAFTDARQLAQAYPQSPLAAREAFATRMIRVALARIGAARASGSDHVVN